MLVITVKYQGQHNLTVRGDCVLRVQAQCVGRWFDSQWQHRWSKPGSQSHWMEEILLTGIRIKVSKKCFYFTKTTKNAIFGSLLLRSAYNSDKWHFNASFILFVTYQYAQN